MPAKGGFRWMVLKNSLIQNMRIEFLYGRQGDGVTAKRARSIRQFKQPC
jgi:hypothetical protein